MGQLDKGKDQSAKARDYRETVISVSIEGRIHYATYEGLISNGPIHRVCLPA